MKTNMGTADKAFRIFVALLIAVLYFTHVITGTLALMLGFIAFAFVITSFISFCPMYLPFGFTTKKEIK